jgi:hypothetical protein
LEVVYREFADKRYDLEQFTADLWQISEPRVDRIDVTRPWRDGARGAVGDYPSRSNPDRPLPLRPAL